MASTPPQPGSSTPRTTNTNTTTTNTTLTRPPILIPITIPSFDEALEKLRALPPLQIPLSTSSLPTFSTSDRTSERHSTSDRHSHSHRSHSHSHSHRHHRHSHSHRCSKHTRKETPEERHARHALRASETPSQRAERHALRLLKRMRKELKRLTAENTYLRFVAELRRLRERPERFELVRRGEGLRWVGGLVGGRDPKLGGGRDPRLSLSWGPLREGGGKDRREKWVIEMEEREREIEELQRGMQGIEIAGTGKYEEEGETMDWEREGEVEEGEGEGEGEVEPQFPVSPIVEEPVFPVSPVEFPSSPVEGGDFSFSESNGEGEEVQWIVDGEGGSWTVEGVYEDGVYVDGNGGQWTVEGGHWTRGGPGEGGEFTFAESPGEFTFAESPGEFTFLPGDGGLGGQWVRRGGGGGGVS